MRPSEPVADRPPMTREERRKAFRKSGIYREYRRRTRDWRRVYTGILPRRERDILARGIRG